MKRKTYPILILSTSALLLTPLAFNSCRSNNQIEDTTSNKILELTNNSFALGDSSLNVSDESINEQWIKNKIIENKNIIFSVKDNSLRTSLINSIFDPNLLSISFISKANAFGELYFVLTYKNNLYTIEDRITFTNFKNNLPLSFKTTNEFAFGDTNIYVDDSSINKDWILNKIIENKNEIFNFNQIISDIDFRNNIVISNIEVFPELALLQFKLSYKIDEQYTSKTITFNNFKSTFTISFKNESIFTLNVFNIDLSTTTINEEWVKNKVIENKNEIFLIEGVLIDKFLFDNITISNIEKIENEGTLKFSLFVNHNLITGGQTKEITFNGFKSSFLIAFKNEELLLNVNLPNMLPSNFEDELNHNEIILYTALIPFIDQILELKNGNIDLQDPEYLFSIMPIAYDSSLDPNVVPPKYDDKLGTLEVWFILEGETENGLLLDENGQGVHKNKKVILTGLQTAQSFVESKIEEINNTNNIPLVFENNNFTETNVKNKIFSILNLNIINESYNFELLDYVQDATNSNLSFKVKLTYNPDNSIVATSNDISVKYNIISDIYESIFNDVKLVPRSNFDYHNITAKNFYRLTNEKQYDILQIYFAINEQELLDKYGYDLQNYKFNVIYSQPFNFLEPRKLVFQLQVLNLNSSSSSYKSKEIIINDFKEDNTLAGQLDQEPIVNLSTPSDAISYKGKLETFLISDLKTTTEDDYIELLNNFSWDDTKLNFMYQIRFGLYQMFSDNFSEINYYIVNDKPNVGFIAVGEGIIKEDRNNVVYGPQPYIWTNGFNKTQNFKAGDRIKFEITYNSNGTKPFLPTRGGEWGDLDYSWKWDFSNSCFQVNNPNNPLFINELFVDHWSMGGPIYLKISVNDTTTINQRLVNYFFYNFVLKRKYSTSLGDAILPQTIFKK